MQYQPQPEAFTDGLSNASGADADGNYWIVRDGETETFELSVTYDPAANGTSVLKLMLSSTQQAPLQQSRGTTLSKGRLETGTVQVTDD